MSHDLLGKKVSTLHFSQCAHLEGDFLLVGLAITQHDRVQNWEYMLGKLQAEFATYEEGAVLCACRMHQDGVRHFQLIDHCHCGPEPIVRIIPLDEEGEFGEPSIHPFFEYRVKYLF
jgi:hypothetical protein